MGFKVKVISADKEVLDRFTIGKVYVVENGSFKMDNGTFNKDWSKETNCTWHGFNRWFNEDPNVLVKFELVEEKQFTKADLKTGMRVKLRNGNKCTILFNTENGDIITGEFWCPLSRYNEDLTRDTGRNDYADIVEVYQPKSNKAYGNIDFEEMKLIFKRPEPRQITKSEAEKLLSEQLEEQVQIIE